MPKDILEFPPAATIGGKNGAASRRRESDLRFAVWVVKTYTNERPMTNCLPNRCRNVRNNVHRKSHPAVWDESCEDYKDKYEKEKASIEIARRIFQDWDIFVRFPW
ncbi:hypothetical protein FQR65_LT11713 [Abscondita terminalis]|nr:hypothetical protein FQR65_LT11713 [Abscondita terminalis]